MKIKNILACSAIACSLTVGVGIVQESISHESVAFAAVDSTTSHNNLISYITKPKDSNYYEGMVNSVVSLADQVNKETNNNAHSDADASALDAQSNDTSEFMNQSKQLGNEYDQVNKNLKKEKGNLTNSDYKILKKYDSLLKNYLDKAHVYVNDSSCYLKDEADTINQEKKDMNKAHTKWINMYNKLTGNSSQQPQ